MNGTDMMKKVREAEAAVATKIQARVRGKKARTPSSGPSPTIPSLTIPEVPESSSIGTRFFRSFIIYRRSIFG